MFRLMLSIVICMMIGCLATLAEAGTAQAVVSFEEPIGTNMPVWAHITFPQSREFLAAQENIRYPFSYTPWDFGLHEFEVTRNGEAVQSLPIKSIFSFTSYSGIAGGSAAPATSPKYRFPLHLRYRFDQPGTYLVRFKKYRVDALPHRTAEYESDWTPLEIRLCTQAQRRNWLKQKKAHPPTDAGLLVGDYLPALLAHPDKDVLKILLNYIHYANDTVQNYNDMVQNYAVNSLSYYGDETVRREISRLIERKGPTSLLAYVLSWRRDLFQSQGEHLIKTLIPFLKSKHAVQVGGALQAFIFLQGQYAGTGKPNTPGQIHEAIWKAMPHLQTFHEVVVLQPLCLFLGGERSDRAREMLWQLSSKPSVREQALICIAWLADHRDLARLAEVLLRDDDADWSLPYQLRKAYGPASIPHLVKALKESANQWVRLACARELAVEARPEAFQFFRDAVEEDRRYKVEVLGFVRYYFMGNAHYSDREVLEFIKAKARETSK